MDDVQSATPMAESLRSSVSPISRLPYNSKSQFVLSIPVARPLPYFAMSPATKSFHNEPRLFRRRSNQVDIGLWDRRIRARLGNGCRQGQSNLDPSR